MSDNEIPDALYYLAEDFSPRSLRRYQLKAILKSYNVNVPSSSKKADMVKLFQKHVESRRDAILAEYEANLNAGDMSDNLGRGRRKVKSVRRDMHEEQEGDPSSNNNDNTSDKEPAQNDQAVDMSENKQHEQENKRSGRDKDQFAIPEIPESWFRRHKTSKVSTKPGEDTLKPSQPPQQQVSQNDERDKEVRAPPSFTAQDSFASSDDDTSLPQKLQELDDRRRSPTRKVLRAPPKFTAQDSFASSDDDASLPQKVEEMRERRSTRSKRYPKNLTRLPEEPVASSSTSDPKRRDSKGRFSKSRKETVVSKDEDDGASDESYTADSSDNEASDEEEELDKELAPSNITGDEVKWLVEDIAKRGSTWRNTFRILGTTYKVLLVLTITATVLILGSRHHNGYCSSDSVQPEEVYGDNGVLSPLVALPAFCIPCPDHGTCVNGQLHCPTFFSRHHHWYNIKGMLPLADECVRDSATGRMIARAEKKIKRELARQQGKAVCNHIVKTGSTKNSPLAKTRGADLYAALLAKDYAHVEDTGKLETIVSVALKSILDDPRVHYWDLEGIPYYGTDDAKLPLWCLLYGMFTTISVQMRWTILGALVSVFAAVYGRYMYTLRKSEQEKTQRQVAVILSELQEQLNRHIQDPDNQDRGYAVSQLRAKLAGANAPESLADWMRLTEAVKREPQIRRGYREIGGEICEYWELVA